MAEEVDEEALAVRSVCRPRERTAAGEHLARGAPRGPQSHLQDALGVAQQVVEGMRTADAAEDWQCTCIRVRVRWNPRVLQPGHTSDGSAQQECE